jgi:hypothetical protein
VPDASGLPALVRTLEDSGIPLAEFALRKASLDEVFLSLTGRHTDSEPGPGDSGPHDEGAARADNARMTGPGSQAERISR